MKSYRGDNIKNAARCCTNGTAKTNQSNKSYQTNSSKSRHLLKFPGSIKKRWIVKRDANGDEYIRLNGRKALGKYGIDHIYLIDEKTVGLWLTSCQIKSRIKNLKIKVPNLRIEQLGDGEAVLSVSIDQVDNLCHAVKARQRRKVSEQERKRLQRISPFARKQKTLTKSTVRTAKTIKAGKAG